MKEVTTDWIIDRPLSKAIEPLAEELSLPLPLAQTLIHRQYDTPDKAKALLSVPDHLGDIDLSHPLITPSADRLKMANQNDRWVLFPDGDADGILAAWLTTELLDRLNVSWEIHFPESSDRIAESERIWATWKDQATGFICLDRGVKDQILADHCAREKRSLLVIDHHLPDDQPEQEYVETTATTLAWKVLYALREEAGISEEDLKKYLAPVAISLVADRALVTGENRNFMHEGFRQLQNSSHLGLLILQKLGARQRFGNFFFGARPITTLLNSLGKSNRGEWALQLLRTQEKRVLRDLAENIRQVHRRRRRHLKQGLEHMQSLSFPDTPWQTVFFLEDFPADQVDLAAGWLSGRRRFPVVLGARDGDQIRCSARAPHGYRLFSALQACSGFLADFGGHQRAAGCRLQPEQWEGFKACMEQALSEQAASNQLKYSVDAEVKLGELDEAFSRELRRLQPFGAGFPPPVFLVRSVYFHPVGREVLLLTDKEGAQQQVILPEYLPKNKILAGPSDVLLQPSTRHSRHLPGFQLIDWK
jgi:single-stranded-DNA-specific exonuclease